MSSKTWPRAQYRDCGDRRVNTVKVDRFGKLKLNSKAVSEEDLLAEILKYSWTKFEPFVIFEAEPETPFRFVMQIISKVHEQDPTIAPVIATPRSVPGLNECWEITRPNFWQ